MSDPTDLNAKVAYIDWGSRAQLAMTAQGLEELERSLLGIADGIIKIAEGNGKRIGGESGPQIVVSVDGQKLAEMIAHELRCDSFFRVVPA
jgi:hypothetical protein